MFETFEIPRSCHSSIKQSDIDCICMTTSEGRVQRSVKGHWRSTISCVCLTNLEISSLGKSCVIHFELRRISYLSTLVIWTIVDLMLGKLPPLRYFSGQLGFSLLRVITQPSLFYQKQYHPTWGEGSEQVLLWNQGNDIWQHLLDWRLNWWYVQLQICVAANPSNPFLE